MLKIQLSVEPARHRRALAWSPDLAGSLDTQRLTATYPKKQTAQQRFSCSLSQPVEYQIRLQ